MKTVERVCVTESTTCQCSADMLLMCCQCSSDMLLMYCQCSVDVLLMYCRWSSTARTWKTRCSHSACRSLWCTDWNWNSRSLAPTTSKEKFELKPVVRGLGMMMMMMIDAHPPARSSLKITNRSFQYAAPYLWNQLPAELREPRQILCPSRSPPITHGGSSSLSPLSSCLTRSFFHSELKTWLFGKSFPSFHHILYIDLFLTYRTDSTDYLPI